MRQYFKHNAVVLFQGDSITDCGRTDSSNRPNAMGNGYPAKIQAIYQALFPAADVTFVNRAVSGNRVRDLLARYENDFLAVQPDFISILIGINDTWRGFDNGDPCPLARFRKEYTELLKKIKNDMPTAEVMLITPFLTHTDPNKIQWHGDLDPKIECVKALAEHFDCILFDYDSILRRLLADAVYTDPSLSADGVHPTDLGQSQLAVSYLQKLKILD